MARETLRGRLAALEKAKQPAAPRGLSLDQAVRLSLGSTPDQVGPPARILEKGAHDLSDLLLATAPGEGPMEP